MRHCLGGASMALGSRCEPRATAKVSLLIGSRELTERVSGVFRAAAESVESGQVISTERPWLTVAMRGVGLPLEHICDHCGAVIGSAAAQAARLGLPPLPRLAEYAPAESEAVHCSAVYCNAVYCSADCQAESQQRCHSVLCPGADPMVAQRWDAFDAHCEDCANSYYMLAAKVSEWQILCPIESVQVLASVMLLADGKSVDEMVESLGWWLSVEWWDTMAGMTEPPPDIEAIKEQTSLTEDILSSAAPRLKPLLQIPGLFARVCGMIRSG